MPTFVHRNVTDTSASIQVPGLSAPLTVLHLSDSHVDVGAERGREQDMRFMHGVYAQGAQDRTSGDVTLAADALASGLERGRAAHAELLCHTGDLVNFPSPMAVQHVQELIKTGKGTESPLPDAFPVLVKAYENTKLPDAIRIAAFLGLHTHATKGIREKASADQLGPKLLAVLKLNMRAANSLSPCLDW